MAMFGENFENFEAVSQKMADEEAELARIEEELREKEAAARAGIPVDKSKAKKGKIQLKSTGLTYQFQPGSKPPVV